MHHINRHDFIAMHGEKSEKQCEQWASSQCCVRCVLCFVIVVAVIIAMHIVCIIRDGLKMFYRRYLHNLHKNRYTYSPCALCILQYLKTESGMAWVHSKNNTAKWRPNNSVILGFGLIASAINLRAFMSFVCGWRVLHCTYTSILVDFSYSICIYYNVTAYRFMYLSVALLSCSPPLMLLSYAFSWTFNVRRINPLSTPYMLHSSYDSSSDTPSSLSSLSIKILFLLCILNIQTLRYGIIWLRNPCNEL